MKLILAPPGAGKTRQLVDQIQGLLNGGVSPFRILATTFSREGARELEERLGGDVPVRTVHSLALWVVRVTARSRGERVPQVIDAEQALTLVERAIQSTGARFVEPAQVQTELAFVRERGGKRQALHPTTAKVIEAYFKLLSEEHRIDFTGILERACVELQDPAFQGFIAGMYILVDESQDLNPLTEWPVLDGFRSRAEEFEMMASPSQQIYGFKGADWEKLAALFPPDTETSSLEHNYRSTPEIIEASRALAGADARHMRPVRASLGLPVVAVACLDDGLEIDFIGQTLSRWRAAGVPLEQIAILSRAHALHYPIEQMLRDRRFPYCLRGEHPDYYNRPEIQAAAAYLALALKPTHEALLEKVVNYPPVGIGVRMRYRLRGDGTLTWKHIDQAIEQMETYPPPVIERLGKLLAFREWSREVTESIKTLPRLVERLLALTDIPEYLASEGDSASLSALAQLAEAAREFETLSGYCDHLETEINAPRESRGVQLSTLHAAKGREWRAVIVTHFQDGVLPLRKMSLSEEQNLAFVGLTRARDLLALTLSQRSAPSPFLSGMAKEERQWP